MTSDRWREVSRIYGAILTKPESDRPTALASLCADDADLRREVESLLNSGTDEALIDRAATEHPSMLGLLPVGWRGSSAKRRCLRRSIIQISAAFTGLRTQTVSRR
jgi:hypothetical protein